MATTFEEVYRKLEAASATLDIARRQGRAALREYVALYAPLYTDRVSGKTVAEIIAEPNCNLSVIDVIIMLGDCRMYGYDQTTDSYSYEPYRNDGNPNIPELDRKLARAMATLVVPPQPHYKLWASFVQLD